MAMDNRLDELSFSIDDFDFDTHVPFPDPNPSPDPASGFKLDEPAPGFDSLAVPVPSTEPGDYAPAISIDDFDRELILPAEPDGTSFGPSMSSLGASLSAGESPSSSYDSDSSDPVLKYISQMLMEENMEDKIWISHDFALQSTEKSLYDALGEQYPNLPDQFQDFDVSQFIESPSSNFSGSSSDKSSLGTTAINTNSSNSTDSNWLHDPGEHNQTITSAVQPHEQAPQSNFDYSSQFYANSESNSVWDANGLVDSSVLVKNIFSDNDSVLQFKRGLEEASKFLPPSSQLFINFENVNSGSVAEKGTSEAVLLDNKSGKEDKLSVSRGRKNHEREDLDIEEGRTTKQSASYVETEEAELSDMLDKVLLWPGKGEPCSPGSCQPADGSKKLQTTAPVRESNVGRGRGRRQGSKSSVDLRALLILCAQAISSNNLRTADELLKQIRENSSPSGDGSQRLAHYFANGLEARMLGSHGGTSTSCHSAAYKRRSVADVLKAYQLHISSCPFKKLSIVYMNYMISKLSEKARVLHIIDFGIGFGFQWPMLIQTLGEQAGGPPKLRITGIDLPQPGFRPAERIEEAGSRLARYCERFNVPFEYDALPSRDWGTIKIEDLKIRPGEVIAVNCLGQFKNLLDETVEEDSPRDAILNLIRRIEPDVFVHVVTNGSYNAPFFLTRFKEALFHLSSIYDMFDATIAAEHRDSQARMALEGEFYGREIMNVVACEGVERVERPETYKQWQVRHTRAGFKQVPLDQEIMKKFQHKLETWYHKDFVLDEDGDWMLLGWKGRIMYATTCWVPM